MFLRKAPSAATSRVASSAITGLGDGCAAGKQAYIVHPDGVGRSRLTLAMIEVHLGSPGTGRNWNTVLKLGALVAG